MIRAPCLSEIFFLQKEGSGRFLVNQQPDLLTASYDYVGSNHEFRERITTDGANGADAADENKQVN
jgi:hypothetical protein